MWSNTTRDLLGVARDQAVTYELFLSLLGPQTVRESNRRSRPSPSSGGRLDFSVKLRSASDNSQWIRARAGLIDDGAGAVPHLSGIILDIDEQKQIEEALRTRESHLHSILRHHSGCDDRHRRPRHHAVLQHARPSGMFGYSDRRRSARTSGC